MLKNNLLKIIVIVGPTASGKSGLAIKLAKKIGGEIISADSRQVYRGMDIGTGKVRKNEGYKGHLRKTKMPFVSGKIRHHLIDIVSPKKQFNASDFKKFGEKAIKEITAKGKIPVIVGGTGFYIDVLLGRMVMAEVPPNPKLRKHLEMLSADHLFKTLLKLNPEYSQTIDRHNIRRLIRALEITKVLGKMPPIKTESDKYEILWLGLRPKDLERRIKERLYSRFRQKMTAEVKKLYRQGVSWKRLESFGLEYRWISRYLRGLISRKDMKENLYKDIVKYSKRQMTWFNKNKEINWIKDQKEADKLIKDFVS